MREIPFRHEDVVPERENGMEKCPGSQQANGALIRLGAEC
jgi:hypothetical protein